MIGRLNAFTGLSSTFLCLVFKICFNSITSSIFLLGSALYADFMSAEPLEGLSSWSLSLFLNRDFIVSKNELDGGFVKEKLPSSSELSCFLLRVDLSLLFRLITGFDCPKSDGLWNVLSGLV